MERQVKAVTYGLDKISDIQVGMPATIYIGGDRYADEVTKITPTMVYVGGHRVRKSNLKRVELNGIILFTGAAVGGFYGLSIGRAVDYRDPHF